MMEGFAEQREVVNLFSVDHEAIDTLSSAEWKFAERLVEAHQPFYMETLAVSAAGRVIA
jgi:hypothetical protein